MAIPCQFISIWYAIQLNVSLAGFITYERPGIMLNEREPFQIYREYFHQIYTIFFFKDNFNEFVTIGEILSLFFLLKIEILLAKNRLDNFMSFFLNFNRNVDENFEPVCKFSKHKSFNQICPKELILFK